MSVDLLEQSSADTEFFNPTGLKKIKVVDVLDGDTIHITIIVEGKAQKFIARMYGCDTTELKKKIAQDNPKTDKDKIFAISAKLALNKFVYNKVVGAKLYGFDKSGRILVELYSLDGKNINKAMIDGGFAVCYSGPRKQPRDWSGDASTEDKN